MMMVGGSCLANSCAPPVNWDRIAAHFREGSQSLMMVQRRISLDQSANEYVASLSGPHCGGRRPCCRAGSMKQIALVMHTGIHAKTILLAVDLVFGDTPAGLRSIRWRLALSTTAGSCKTVLLNSWYMQWFPIEEDLLFTSLFNWSPLWPHMGSGRDW